MTVDPYGISDCVSFLQWALPQMHLKWSGYRKVRGTVCKRVKRRMRVLGLSSFEAYHAHLADAPEEWAILESYCRIPISRFFRDRGVYRQLGDVVLPQLGRQAADTGQTLRAWSAGCASGEEPYSLSILWRLHIQSRFPDVGLEIVATDVDETMIERCAAGCYQPGSLRDVPPEWAAQAFEKADNLLCVRPAFRKGVTFALEDIKKRMPKGPFALVLCRNLAFTYFDEPVQRRILNGLAACMQIGGFLVIGAHERLPDGQSDFEPAGDTASIYRKIAKQNAV